MTGATNPPVDDFRHQNFRIWTVLGEVMAILVKDVCKTLNCIVDAKITPFFHQNGHNFTQKSPNSKILVPKVIN